MNTAGNKGTREQGNEFPGAGLIYVKCPTPDCMTLALEGEYCAKCQRDNFEIARILDYCPPVPGSQLEEWRAAALDPEPGDGLRCALLHWLGVCGSVCGADRDRKAAVMGKSSALRISKGETMAQKTEEKELIPINIGNVNDGAMIDGFEIELQKAPANIADLNTRATDTRVVKLELVLKPHSDRVVIETEFKCVSKLAPIETHKSKVFLGRTKEGGLVAFDADPRQMSLWSAPAPAEVQKPIEFKQNS